MLAHLLFKIRVYISYCLNALDAHGLHSPFIFDFYNDVIDAKKEFYFFKQFRELISKSLKQTPEANALFLYRWTVFYRPNSAFVPNGNFTASLALSVPSANKLLSVSSIQCFSESEMHIFKELGISITEANDADLVYLDDIGLDTLEEILKYNCVIISRPHESKVKDAIWTDLCALKPVSISIDLFQFGILLLHKKQVKQHFVVKMH